MAAISKDRPDLVFLDVQMPELDGFGVLEQLDSEARPAVVFVTAHDKFALRAFEVHALDYLLKPFDSGRFKKALERARDRIQRQQTGELSHQISELLADLKTGVKHPERLAIKSGGKVLFLKLDEIDWIEAADNYVRLHAAREAHLLRETMNSLEKRLDPEQFIRVHRSRIVNTQRVKELRPLFRGEYDITLKDGTRLETGRGYRDRVQRLFTESS
ncbi:MAG: DNA-binding response regulator [Verrucomicrobia bacterium]|nr:MAG: DNA-binding response regulator [Verrucomicrobiota bacterium]